jgi:hypothetical protein
MSSPFNCRLYIDWLSAMRRIARFSSSRRAAASPPGGILLVALTGLLLAACTNSPSLSSPEASPAQASAQSCPRPALDDAAALTALESDIGPISLSGTLVNRFAAAHRSMEAAAGAGSITTASCEAENVLFLLVGPYGRNAPPGALTPGILPADRDPLSDPGVAMTAMMIMSDAPAAEAIGSGILGDMARWSRPTAGWTEIDAAVTDGSVATLDSQTMQAIGWALLVQRSASVDEAHRYARSGIAATSTALQSARQALDVSCVTFPEARCRR